MSRRARVTTALVMAPVAIGAVLLLPTPLLAALIAGLMMLGLWEWTLLSATPAPTARAAYLAANVSMMTALAWAAGGGQSVLQIAAYVGVAWWLLVLVWLSRFNFASVDSFGARVLKLVAGSLSVIPAWAALCWLHLTAPNGPAWALYALLIVWLAGDTDCE